MFASRTLLSSLLVLGFVALPIVTAVPDEIGKHINTNGIKIDPNEDHYNCADSGVHCIFVGGDYKSYSVYALDSAQGRCTKQFEEPSTGKTTGPTDSSGYCKADSTGSFLIECTVTQGSSYVVVDFEDRKTTAHAVGQSTVQLRSRNQKTKYAKDNTINYGGIDAYIRCPNAP